MVHYDTDRKFIFSLYGPTKSGKSSLIEEMTTLLPDDLTIIRSVTTRTRRGLEDDMNYSRFFTRDEFNKRISQGKMIQHIEYAGNMYGTDRDEVNDILSRTHGICAMVEKGMANMAAAGYQIVPVQIIPLGTDAAPDAKRKDEDLRRLDDAVRAQSTTQPLIVIVNDFRKDGLQRAVTTLHRDIIQFLLDPNTR